MTVTCPYRRTVKRVKSIDIYVSNGTQQNSKIRDNTEKRKKAIRRRKRGPHWVANSIESSREASQYMLANAVGDEGVTSYGEDTAGYEK